ncbi:MAG TPA: class I SAM-dependent methyltransferase [Pyrinomonadaceae bacterium]|nr:class I SAM-dependent methyltransferase [Pyrinomonadaceae bacterium]
MEKGKKIWDSVGATDPYFAVYSVEKYLDSNLNENAKEDFFSSGLEYVEKLWVDLERIFGFEPRPKRVLDFGCGVGRLLFALARRSERAVGVDISESMLTEARGRIAERGIENVELMETSAFLRSSKTFDLIHSFIVLQHIDPDEGMAIIKRSVEMLEDGGIGMLHVTFHDPSSRMQRIKSKIDANLGPLRPVAHKLRGGTPVPWLPMNVYDMNAVLELLRSLGCYNVSIKFTDHGMIGAMIFLQKGGSIDYS